MSGDNGYRVKAEIRPEDYKHGPPYIFTKEDMVRWQESAGAKECFAKAEAQANMTPEEIKALDEERFIQSEESFKEIMKGPEDA